MMYVYRAPAVRTMGLRTFERRPGKTAHLVSRTTKAGVLVTACGRRFSPQNMVEDTAGVKPVCTTCDASSTHDTLRRTV